MLERALIEEKMFLCVNKELHSHRESRQRSLQGAHEFP